MKKASNWAAKWFASPSPPPSPSDNPSAPRSVHSTISSASRLRLLHASKPKSLYAHQITNDSTASVDTDSTSAQQHPYGALGSTTTTATVSCSSFDTTSASLEESNSYMLGYRYNAIKKDRSFLKPWKRHKPHPQGLLAQAALSAPDIRFGPDEKNMTLSTFPEPPGQSFSVNVRSYPPGGSGSSVSSGKSNLRNMFLPRDTPEPEPHVHHPAMFSSSSSSVCSVNSTSLTVIRHKASEQVTISQKICEEKQGQSKGIQGWSERLSLQSKRLRSSLLSNGTKKAFTPSALGSGIYTHSHSTTSLPPTTPGTPTSLSHVSYPSPSPASSKVAAETRITVAEAAQTRDTETPATIAAVKDVEITKETPLPPLSCVPPPPLHPQVHESGDNLSLAYGLMLQSLPEEELGAQVANLFGIALHFQQKIERLEKELQALEKRRLVPRRSMPKKVPLSLPPAPNQPLPKIPEQENLEETKTSLPPSPIKHNTQDPDGSGPSSTANLIKASSTDLAKHEKTQTAASNKSENEDHDVASLSETLEQDATQKVHEDLKAEIRRDLQASRSIYTALLSPTVISLIQSSFPNHRHIKSGRGESKVVTSPVVLGYVPSMSVQDGEYTGISSSSPGAGRSMLRSGTVSDQIIYPSALRSNPILLSRGLKVVQSDSSTPKTTSSPIALDEAISSAEENDQERKPLIGTGSRAATSAVVSGEDTPVKEDQEGQETNDKGNSSPSSLPPPRPQRPKISADLDYLMTVFHSQLIAHEQSWLEKSGSGLGQIEEEDPSKRDENKNLSSTSSTCLRSPPPAPQHPELINPAPVTSSSSSSSPNDHSLVRKTPSPPNSSPSSSASISIALTDNEMSQLQNRQLRLEQDVQHLMDVLTGHAHIQAQRSQLHQCHAGRCSHVHHHPRYYPPDEEKHAQVVDEDEQNEGQYASARTPLPPHIEELQHHIMHSPGYGYRTPQPFIRDQETTNKMEEVRAEILEGSGPAIETSVLSTITTTTAHTTVIDVPTWPSRSSSSLLTPSVGPLVVRTNKNKMQPTSDSSPSAQLASSSSSSSSSSTPSPRTLTTTNTTSSTTTTMTTTRDDMTRRIAQLQHSRHETQALHEQLDQFWDRLQTVESSQRAGLWQERYHDLHERLLDMEFWKRSGGGGSKNKDGKK